jgi:DNA-binding transcriptional MerR regulator
LGSKLYYSIGEVADLTALAPYTLRAWESEFACLRPKRVRGKNRAYRKRDIAIIFLIRRLLHEERYSTRGAQQKLRNEPELVRGAVEQVDRLSAADPPTLEELSFAGRGEGSSGVIEAHTLLDEVRDELREILRLFR